MSIIVDLIESVINDNGVYSYQFNDKKRKLLPSSSSELINQITFDDIDKGSDYNKKDFNKKLKNKKDKKTYDNSNRM